MMRMSVGVALVVAASMSLVGCVSTLDAPTSSASAAELEQYRVEWSNLTWHSLYLDDAIRPPLPEPEYVDPDEDWTQIVADCMSARGYVGYRGSADGYSIGDYQSDDAEAVDWYLCQVTHHPDPAEYGLPSRENLEYQYEHIRLTLVPCLEVHGRGVDWAPTRKQALTWGGEFAGWNPYYTLEDFDPYTRERDRDLLQSCPMYPSGEIYDEIRNPWGVGR